MQPIHYFILLDDSSILSFKDEVKNIYATLILLQHWQSLLLLFGSCQIKSDNVV